MRKTHLLATLALFFVASAFTWLVQPQEKYTVSVSDSKVHWLAKKVTGQHEGDVLIKSGEVTIKNKKLTGGTFTMDMTSISCTDIKNEGGNKKLVGHLKSADFFDVANNPTATLKITSAKATGATSIWDEATNDKSEGYDIVADLTIKGKTNSVTFTAYITQESKTVKAKGAIKFDRTKYDIRYGSSSFFEGLGDKAIYNDVELTINVTAKSN